MPRLFFMVWNFILGLSLVRPVWLKFRKEPTVTQLIIACLTLASPFVLAGIFIPLLLGQETGKAHP